MAVEPFAHPISRRLRAAAMALPEASEGESCVNRAFRDGYNLGAADLYVYDLETGALDELVSDGSTNVNLPGSCWSSASERIVFSSDRDPHDEIWTISADGSPGDEVRLTDRAVVRCMRSAQSAGHTPDGHPNASSWAIHQLSGWLSGPANGSVTSPSAVFTSKWRWGSDEFPELPISPRS